MWGHLTVTLLLALFAAEVPLHAAAGNAGRTLLQPRTKLVARKPQFMAAMAAGCSSDEECFDFTINLNYDKAKNVVSDVVASGTWQYVDATGAGGFVGGGCEADAGAKGDPKVSLSVTKNTPNGLKEIKTMLRWSSQARCAASLEAPPPVPSSQKMFYFGTRCEVMVYEWSSSKPGQYCNNRYTGRTYAEINYDQNKPPNAMQADKDQWWYCKDLTFSEGVCDNNCS